MILTNPRKQISIGYISTNEKVKACPMSEIKNGAEIKTKSNIQLL